MADPAIHDSSAVTAAIELHNAGKACFTTTSYTPLAGDEAKDVKISVRIERKIGSSQK
jgi:hypothetical protein